jgi:hypothetical protein
MPNEDACNPAVGINGRCGGGRRERVAHRAAQLEELRRQYNVDTNCTPGEDGPELLIGWLYLNEKF